MGPLDSLRPQILTSSLPWPKEIFGNDQTILHEIRTVVLNIVEVIASLLLDNNIVGNNLEKFVSTYTPQYNSNNERVYSDITGCIWFKKTEAAVRAKWGPHVKLLAVDLNSDKTQADRLHAQNFWPCNVSICNLISAVRHSDKGADIVGYCPSLPYSREVMLELLTKNFGVRRACDKVYVILKR